MSDERKQNSLFVTYWNDSSMLTMRLQIEYGTLFLGSQASRLWISFSQASFGTKDLTIQGSVSTLNELMQSLLYVGPNNFNGENSLVISVTDEYKGSVNTSIKLIIKPVNDPPYILAPYKLVLNSDGSMGHGFYENNTQFANEHFDLITIGDPDEFDIRGDFGEELQVEVLVKVDVGMLTLRIPHNAFNELEVMRSDGIWVQFEMTTLARHREFVTVSAQAMMFQSSVNNSNLVLQSLKYQGASMATLSIIVNDLGSWGCSQDCESATTSIPLSKAATIFLAFSSTIHSSPSRRKIILAATLTPAALLATIVLFLLVPFLVIKHDQEKCIKQIKSKKLYEGIKKNEEAHFHDTRVSCSSISAPYLMFTGRCIIRIGFLPRVVMNKDIILSDQIRLFRTSGMRS